MKIFAPHAAPSPSRIWICQVLVGLWLLALPCSMADDVDAVESTAGSCFLQATSATDRRNWAEERPESAQLPEDPDPGNQRGAFAQHCRLYPGKRVVLVTVNAEYLDMFKNWLHFAKPFLTSTEQLRVIAEEADAVAPLQELREQSLWFDLVSPSGASLVQAPFGSQGFNKLVGQRPSRVLALLKENCTVLYADIDTAWVKDPFLDIAAAGPGALVVTNDNENWKGSYVCTCFLYMQPTPEVNNLTLLWARKMTTKRGQATNDQIMFDELLSAPANLVGMKMAYLPVEKYPPGNLAQNHPNASVYHANWREGIEQKVAFMKEHKVWVM